MVKTNELTGAALDWAVAICADLPYPFVRDEEGQKVDVSPSTNWHQAGPIIEREIAKIERFSDSLWEATTFTRHAQDYVQNGPTPLIAAMRCYVASKLGDEVDVPDELMEPA